MLHGRWTRENRTALAELLERDYSHPPIAVFDWDGTCIRGDIADAVFHHLARDLAYRFDVPGFWDWISEVDGVDSISPVYNEYRASPSAETRLNLRLAFEQKRAMMLDGPDDTPVLAWDSGAFLGWSVAEVRTFTRAVIGAELARPLEAEVLDGVKIEWGLRIRPEMQELMGLMQKAGWNVWVISASPRWEVEEFAALYGVPSDRVIGISRQVVQGRISGEILSPISFSDGKLDAYQTCISRDERPWFCAGDSVNDWKILEWAEGLRVLVEPAHPSLHEFALWRQREGETWLLQSFP